MLVATGCGLVDVVLAMAGKTFWTFANSVIALMIMVVADLLLIPDHGITGAAIGWSMAILFNNLVPLTAGRPEATAPPVRSQHLVAAAAAAATLGSCPARSPSPRSRSVSS